MLTEHDLQSRIFHYINEIEMYESKETRVLNDAASHG